MKDFFFLIKYSVQSVFYDMLDFLSTLKKPKTWSFIMWACIVIGVYYKWFAIIWVAIPVMFVLYTVRQQKDPGFSVALHDKAFVDNDEKKIKEYYEKYLRECYFAKRQHEEYATWKEEELSLIKKKRYSAADSSDTQ